MWKELKYLGVEYKSLEEVYFAAYLEELRINGFISSFHYEKHTFELTDSVSIPYLKQLKTKVVSKDEHILAKTSLTSDFTIYWNDKASNIFFLDKSPIRNVKRIPFRVDNNLKISEVEIKAINESNTSSSISFPVKQKWVYDKHKIFIQKIKPFDPKNVKSLFTLTFYPEFVINDLTYKRTTKFGIKGTTKIKGKFKTIKTFLETYDN